MILKVRHYWLFWPFQTNASGEFLLLSSQTNNLKGKITCMPRHVYSIHLGWSTLYMNNILTHMLKFLETHRSVE